MATTEPTVNDAIATVLRELRSAWAKPGVVRSEHVQVLRGAKRPDILIMESGNSPVAVETEIVPAPHAEDEAMSRLGETLRENGKQVLSSIAVKVPDNLRTFDGSSLAAEIRSQAIFQFVCFTGTTSDSAVRWPKRGWMTGGIRDLCLACQAMTIPPPLVNLAADQLASGVGEAAGRLDEIGTAYSGALTKIAALLKQENSSQTRRMAMTIVANAFVFHSSLAGRGGDLASIRSLNEIRGGTQPFQSAVLDEWRKILIVNYWPIFEIARQIVECLPSVAAADILIGLANTADTVLASGLIHSHDLVGAIFQTLIVDRKFLAAFYTKPASSALLAGLALSPDKPPRHGSWADLKEVTALRVADLACGTGTLLSTVYQCIRQNHEFNGGDEEQLHAAMMSDVLLGCDIMPAATHITASMLSGAHPSIRYTNSSIITMPYAKQNDGSISLGSLDLLEAQKALPILATHGAAIGGHGERVADTWQDIPHDSFDLVIMNPPFTRPTNHEGNKRAVPNPMFAAFSSTKAEQTAMAAKLKKLARGSAYNGNAGEASAFLALGDKKLANDGVLGLVLPLSLQAGEGWKNARTLLSKSYRELCIVSIAAHKDAETSFSADTGMSECLVVGIKTEVSKKKAQGNNRAIFVILKRSPSTQLEGAMIARIVRQQMAKPIRKLEDGPIGGTPIRLGDDVLGAMIDAPIASGDAWPISRVSDLAIAQTAFHLVSRGRLWLPGTEEKDSFEIPICRLDKLANVGPLHRDINGTEKSGTVMRGPFDIVSLTPGQEPTYPALWGHEASIERSMLVAPDNEATIRTSKSGKTEDNKILAERAAKLWASASRCHFNYNFRFNSQSISACYTERECLGGRAWPSIIFNDPLHEKAFLLWANSTLGLMCYWWNANRQQAGRGEITLTAIPRLSLFDFRPDSVQVRT